MMWNRTAVRVVPVEPVPDTRADTPPAFASEPTLTTRQGETVEALLSRWMELSELERRAFLAMARELAVTSSVIEHSAIDLSQRFQTLAEHARAQVVAGRGGHRDRRRRSTSMARKSH